MLIKNCIIIDGMQQPRYEADIRIEKNLIHEIGNLHEHNNERVINAQNNFVVPGFVDILNHSDVYLTLFSNAGQNSLVQQGITTILMGNCGTSLAPLTNPGVIMMVQKWADPSLLNVNWMSMGEYLAELDHHHLRINVGTLVGHSTLRRGILGDSFREANSHEIKQMQFLLDNAMNEGAFGLSTGFAYSHAKIASASEIDALLDVVKKYDGLYSAHLRDEGEHLIPAVEEALDSASRNTVHLEISHFKAMGETFWSNFSKAIDMITEARSQGVFVNFDLYPYTTTLSVLYIFLPDWVAEGGKKKMLERIQDSVIRKRLVQEMRQDPHQYDRMVIASANLDPTFIGRTIKEIAKNQETSIEDAVLNMLSASEGRVSVFTTTLSEANIMQAVQNPYSFTSSDGIGYLHSDGKSGKLVHPRSFGAFPRYFSRYIQENNLLTWEQAIYKATYGPAQKIGLKNRGKIEKGAYADIVIFNPKKIKDNATFQNPYQYPSGINWVIVNGEVAVRDGKTTTNRAGEILRRE
ncbi:MAG: amidohydrolase family protein [Candidatus Spechtbacteria bacterium]|nr:amidohydrolase family protein [Candidatus Spechtbacteria bacterium]